MKLVFVIVMQNDLDELDYSLRRRGHQATVIDQSGGLGGPRTATLLIGVQETWVFDVLGIIEETCRERMHHVSPAALLGDAPDVVSRPIDERAGGAMVFILNVERYERIT